MAVELAVERGVAPARWKWAAGDAQPTVATGYGVKDGDLGRDNLGNRYEYDAETDSWDTIEVDGARNVNLVGATVPIPTQAPYSIPVTLDTSAVNSQTIPNTIVYKELAIKISGLPTGVTIGINGDMDPAQGGTYSADIGMRTVSGATTANLAALTNGSFVHEGSFPFYALKIYTTGTPAAGTATILVTLR